jgi:hypothetical protein
MSCFNFTNLISSMINHTTCYIRRDNIMNEIQNYSFIYQTDKFISIKNRNDESCLCASEGLRKVVLVDYPVLFCPNTANQSPMFVESLSVSFCCHGFIDTIKKIGATNDLIIGR